MKAVKSPMIHAVKEAYRLGQEDETLEPIIGCDQSCQPHGRIQKGDSVIFYDIRGEREIELTQSLTEKDFPHFPVLRELDLNFVTMIEYSASLSTRVAFPQESRIKNTFSEAITQKGFRLLKIAESEKAIHVGFFFNGKSRDKLSGEEMVVIPSPEGIQDYALTPEMSVNQTTEEIIRGLQNPAYQVVVTNLANVDVVGHSENRKSVIRAVEAVDNSLGRIADACIKYKVSLVVTADHGTVEEWLYPDGKINTGHTNNEVPFILVAGSGLKQGDIHLRPRGELADVAPTMLDLLGIPKPLEMTGESLLTGFEKKAGRAGRLLLLILDGWGIREGEHGNLIREAETPHFDRLWKKHPHSFLKASGIEVGMPEGTVGNSEAGHLHIGAGRRVLLDRVRIDRAIKSGDFQRNEALLWAMKEAERNQRPLHLMGIVSHFSSHGSIDHLFALLQMVKARGVEHVYVHALIGRRGERPESGAWYIGRVEEFCKGLSAGQLVTVMGRFWALDREDNWGRVEKAYRALVWGEGRRAVLG